MASACVMFAFTPVGDVDVMGVVPYPLADGQACPADAFVLLDATQAQQLMDAAANNPNQLPPTEQLSAAWGASFVLVVGCYVIARQIGAVVNFLK